VGFEPTVRGNPHDGFQVRSARFRLVPTRDVDWRQLPLQMPNSMESTSRRLSPDWALSRPFCDLLRPVCGLSRPLIDRAHRHQHHASSQTSCRPIRHSQIYRRVGQVASDIRGAAMGLGAREMAIPGGSHHSHDRPAKPRRATGSRHFGELLTNPRRARDLTTFVTMPEASKCPGAHRHRVGLSHSDVSFRGIEAPGRIVRACPRDESLAPPERRPHALHRSPRAPSLVLTMQIERDVGSSQVPDIRKLDLLRLA